MEKTSLSIFFGVCILLILSACNHVKIEMTPSTEYLSVPPVENINTPGEALTPSLTPINTMTTLPPSATLGAILSGTGVVARSLLTYEDLMNGSSTSPVDESAFALPAEAANPGVVFEGRLQISASNDSDSRVIRDDLNHAAEPARLQLPAFDLHFVQDGSFLIPTAQGLVYTGNPYWNYIVGPGRIWREDGDQGYARLSFPFALVERNQNCTHNGVMTFLFNGTNVSRVRYQITQETCRYFKFNLWGQASATYTPVTILQADAIKAASTAERSSRLPTKPLEALRDDYPDAQVNLGKFGSGITPGDMTAYGLVVRGVNYVAGCRTRYGEYAYCESMRLPSYSTAKSAFAGVALMRLGQKYGTDIYNLLIKDYVQETPQSIGNWSKVTFRNALDMATGNYDQIGFEVDEYGPVMTAFLDQSETYTDKIRLAFRFPGQKLPGQVWVYHTSDIFIVTRAMNNFLVQKEGNGADIFNLVRDEVYIPLNLSAGALTTVRTDNSPSGVPLGGYGLFWTQDDIAKIAMLLNDLEGNISGIQILEPGLLSASMQKDPNDRGLNTSGVPIFKYRNGFWAKEWTPSENRHYTCTFWTSFMSGYGGITVVLMPNGAVYYYFSDNDEFAWYDAVNESNKLIPMCP